MAWHSSLNTPKVVGLVPWLPWPLCHSAWWTEPIRAERLAAFRIGLGVVLLYDVLSSYLPRYGDYFGQGSLGDLEQGKVFLWTPFWQVNLLLGVNAAWAWLGIFVLWTLAATLILMGAWPRRSACFLWLLSASFMQLNAFIHNTGDWIRTIGLFYLMLSPCAAAWSLDRRRQDRNRPSAGGEETYTAFISPWPVRLLFIQLLFMYFNNGIFKLGTAGWRDGTVMYNLVQDPGWARWSIMQQPLPFFLIQILTWGVMLWEIFFPFLLILPRTRWFAIWSGVIFHLGTYLSMRLGAFPLYAICLYLPLFSWEEYRWLQAPRRVS